MTEKPVYILAHHVVTPLADGTAENLDAMAAGKTAVFPNRQQLFQDQGICGALFSPQQRDTLSGRFGSEWTAFEILMLHSLRKLLLSVPHIRMDDPSTLLVLASTKGNIGDLQEGSARAAEQAGLHRSVQKIAADLGYHSRPVLVSNACISGMTALLVAKRFLDAGRYKHAVVVGADCISPFIMAGFRSFQALSDEECKPFDCDRKGLNLGEGAGGMVLSTEPPSESNSGSTQPILLSGGASSNDANHISGPSRTGAEMAYAIRLAMKQAKTNPADIGFIAAHGTATPYNDEMESKAFTLAALDQVPAFSLKAVFGHTLGAAGLIESAIGLEAMERGWILPSRGYSNHGVSSSVRISVRLEKEQDLKHFIKTGSGFGGCNAALVFSKTN